MADLTVGPGGFKPSFAKLSFHASHLELLLEEVDLTAERLTLLIHGAIPVDFGHKTPVVDGKLVEFSMECGESGATPSESGYEPHR